MSATTVNAFPPLHSFNSSRSWFLAFIVLLHVGFFWGLTHGVSVWDINRTSPPFVVIEVPDKPQPPPVERKPKEPDIIGVFVPTPPRPPEPTYDEETSAPRQVTTEPAPTPTTGAKEGPGSPPLIVEPQLAERGPVLRAHVGLGAPGARRVRASPPRGAGADAPVPRPHASDPEAPALPEARGKREEVVPLARARRDVRPPLRSVLGVPGELRLILAQRQLRRAG